jgi:cysteine synthase/rhodanese-related sulfurtransferase
VSDHSLRVYESILGLLSGEDNPTPLVKLTHVVRFKQARVYGKLEWYNPFGAVKDRVAANLVADAEARGVLSRGKKLVEPTSGNTGLGLTMIGNAKGYPLRSPLSSAIPVEKRAILRFVGCDVQELDDTLCPAPGAPEGAIQKAMDTAKDDPNFKMLNQYDNEANPEAHYRTTGPEIWRQTEGQVTHLVAALGTCGTITGTGRFLKEKNPKVQVIAVHPNEGHDIPGVRSIRQLKQTRFFSPQEYDRVVEVNDKEAYEMCLRLNREESVVAGPSSGMALAGALKVIEDQPGALVVVIFPDNVFKYASSLLRHFPEMYAGIKGGPTAAPAPEESPLLDKLVENSRNSYDTISIDEVVEQLTGAQKPVLVDVRQASVYEKAHVEGALNISLETLTASGAATPGLPAERNTPIVTVCNRGNMSLTGMLIFKSLGYKNVRSMNGGTMGWMDKGLPTRKG